MLMVVSHTVKSTHSLGYSWIHKIIFMWHLPLVYVLFGINFHTRIKCTKSRIFIFLNPVFWWIMWKVILFKLKFVISFLHFYPLLILLKGTTSYNGFKFVMLMGLLSFQKLFVCYFDEEKSIYPRLWKLVASTWF